MTDRIAWPKTPSAFIGTEYGTVEAQFLGGNRVMVDVATEAGKAHINDGKPALVYRGEQYIGSVWLDVVGPGVTVESTSLSRRSNWTDAPKTYAGAMASAIASAVKAFLAEHSDMLVEGERAHLTRDLSRAFDTLEETRKAFHAARTTVRDLERALAKLPEPKG